MNEPDPYLEDAKLFELLKGLVAFDLEENFLQLRVLLLFFVTDPEACAEIPSSGSRGEMMMGAIGSNL